MGGEREKARKGGKGGVMEGGMGREEWRMEEEVGWRNRRARTATCRKMVEGEV